MPVVQQKARVIRRRTEYCRPEKLTRTLNLREFYEKRNKVLIIRACGGLGDILMHRMIFEDFKRLNPQAEIHFACPPRYHDAVSDHPFVDQVLDSDEVKRHDYLVSYTTTTACGRYEMGIAPLSGKHRSDIWANHCGVELTKHNMHLNLTEEEKRFGKELIESNRDRPGASVALCPISAMHNKNLMGHHMVGVVEGLRDRGLYVFGLHSTPVETLMKNDVPMIEGLKIRQWMGVLNQVDYVVSVDTAHFHCAGGMGKPTVGVFTFVNAETYAKYYPKVELVQGPCPDRHQGCYNWGACPYKQPLPCCEGLSVENIMSCFDHLICKYPL